MGRVIFVILMFNSFLVKSQSAQQAFALANNAFQIGDYYSAKSAYTRAAYFTQDSQVKKHCYMQLAQIALVTDNIDDAVNRLKNAAFEEADQSEKNSINLQRVKLIVLNEDFKNANFEILQLNIDSSSAQFIDYTLLRGMISLGLEEYENAKKQQDAFSKSEYPEGAQLCAKCNETAVIMLDGCMTCLACGDSKCG